MPNPHPLGEEIWIRRDLESRGGPFIFRELIFVGTLLMPAVTLLILAFAFPLYQTGNLALQIVMAVSAVAMLISYCLSFFIFIYYIFCASRFSPLWLYAEQLNPETLTIHRLGKQPIQIQLAESTIKKQTAFKYYTIITITDKDKNSATLPALTPEETDRFMAYWNAANPPVQD